MSAEGRYNCNSPAVKRILRECKELVEDTDPTYTASPLEDNLFEWHFTVRGPEGTAFEGGRYHGRILLPADYPFKPPSILFLTPSGRFEVNTKICLTITGFHPEFWQPAWGVRTALLAIISFFPQKGEGAVGALDYRDEDRRELARKSAQWKCSQCEMTMEELMPGDGKVDPESPMIPKEDVSMFHEAKKDVVEDGKESSEKNEGKEGGRDTSGGMEKVSEPTADARDNAKTDHAGTEEERESLGMQDRKKDKRDDDGDDDVLKDPSSPIAHEANVTLPSKIIGEKAKASTSQPMAVDPEPQGSSSLEHTLVQAQDPAPVPVRQQQQIIQQPQPQQPHLREQQAQRNQHSPPTPRQGPARRVPPQGPPDYAQDRIMPFEMTRREWDLLIAVLFGALMAISLRQYLF